MKRKRSSGIVKPPSSKARTQHFVWVCATSTATEWLRSMKDWRSTGTAKRPTLDMWMQWSIWASVSIMARADKDETQAVAWYQKAADLGNAQAMFNLGCCYEHGEGVEKQDDSKAVEWYRKPP